MAGKESKAKEQVTREWVHTLFRRYFEGKATKKETEVVETWKPRIREKEESEAPEWMISEDRDEVWKKMAAHYGFGETPGVPHLKPAPRVIPIVSARKYVAVAAVILLTAGSVFYFAANHGLPTLLTKNMSPAETLYQTGESEIKRITLPDGSVVHLNGDTRLSIIAGDFNKKKREVRLEEGEAFFEVTRNPAKPFIVYSRHLQTTVRGTSFNIKAYEELGEDVVAVRTGKVEVSTGTEAPEILTRNHQLAFHVADGHTIHGEINADELAAWTEGRLVLAGAGVDELKLRLKQHFGAELVLAPGVLDSALFHSSYPRGTPLDDIMEDICIVYGLTYERKCNRLILSDI